MTEPNISYIHSEIPAACLHQPCLVVEPAYANVKAATPAPPQLRPWAQDARRQEPGPPRPPPCPAVPLLSLLLSSLGHIPPASQTPVVPGPDAGARTEDKITSRPLWEVRLQNVLQPATQPRPRPWAERLPQPEMPPAVPSAPCH